MLMVLVFSSHTRPQHADQYQHDKCRRQKYDSGDRPVPPDAAVNDGVLSRIGKIKHSDLVAWPMARWVTPNIILKFYGHVLLGVKSDNRIVTVVPCATARTVFFL